MAHNIELGRRGEQVAAEHLASRGMRVLDRNWRCALGELDLVVRDGDCTVFVEVKTRTGPGFGHPFEAITALKLARLRRLALAWCEAHQQSTARIRIDAVAVHAPSTDPAIVEHLEGIG